MKILHCVGWYFPESVGGSEIYVQRLVRELAARGVDGVVAAPYDAPCGATELRSYTLEGVRVRRYPVPPPEGDAQRLGRAPHGAFDRFEALLDEERADVLHLHSYTFGANEHHVRAARARGLRAFVTVHAPTFMCTRGTMRRMGRETCDGRIDPEQCVPCFAQWRGVPEPVARVLGAGLGRLPRHLPVLPGPAGTLLAMPEIVAERARRIARLFDDVERVVAVCDWLRAALLVNGAPAEWLTVCRQGVDAPLPPALRARPSGAPLTLGYFGRADPTKGIDVLIDAVRALPPAPAVELRLHVIANSAEDRFTLQQLVTRAAGDPRIAFREGLPPAAVPAAMQAHDVVAVPSRWLETGPLVAMEALAQGVPVLGSRLGGLAELVEHEVSGWLEPEGDVARWAARIAALAHHPEAVEKAAENARRVRILRSGDVAEAMLALYRGERRHRS